MRYEIIKVNGEELFFKGDRPFSATVFFMIDHRPELLDIRAEEGLPSAAELEAVELRRIVAGGDHDPAVNLQLEEREVEDRRRTGADIDHIDSGGEEARQKRFAKRGAAEPDIVTERDLPAARLKDQRAERLSEHNGNFFRERGPVNAPDIVFSEYR